jgi:hypothetical protein
MNQASRPPADELPWSLERNLISGEGAVARCQGSLRKAKRSALMVSACVVNIPCGQPL